MTEATEELFIADIDTYLIYDHRADGKHEGKQVVKRANIGAVLLPILRRARAEKRTVIVTDTADLCVLHLDEGDLIHPSPEDIAKAKEKDVTGPS